MAGEPQASGSFFGRRKGKTLRPGQDRLVRTLLPKLRLDPSESRCAADIPALFSRPVDAIHLEIGFGGGEHLAHVARTDPAIGFIGCEPFVNGVAKLLAVIEAERIGNVRIWDGDATDLIADLAEGCIARAYLLFPDPWPKWRQRKRRFVSDRNLAGLARILRSGAELRFATDIDDYAGWALARVLRSPDFRWVAPGPDAWRRPWAGWPGTRYEAKARAAGRSASYLTFVRT